MNAQAQQLLELAKSTDQDFEWYPTTPQMIDAVKKDFSGDFDHPSILDCGAGDGRVLQALTDGDRYAIEKSRPLLDAMDRSIFIVGTEFAEQTLIDKKVDLVFCNPPYSEFSLWMLKIIREANAPFVYFVVPSRWSDDPAIAEALAARSAEADVIGQFDFLHAERQARARVDIVRVRLCYNSRYSSQIKVDPFSLWFEENFAIEINNTEASKYDLDSAREATVSERVNQALVAGSDIVTALEKLYRRDLDNLIGNYQSLEAIDPVILKELDVNLEGLRAALRQKIEGLKDTYWKELFNHLSKITERLTHKTREAMLSHLTAHTHVDYTASNAYAVLIWVLKNANVYFDDQLVALVERMTEKASIQLYVSNQNTFGDEQWRYCTTPKDLDRYGLDYRIVLHRTGGICTSQWSYDRNRFNGLEERAFHLVNDILTIANNLGFETGHCNARQYQWESNKRIDFDCHRSGKTVCLMQVRAFMNGNLHIKFNQSFICKLNVEFGRLKGWLKSAKQASDELLIDEAEAVAAFDSNLSLTADNVLRLAFSAG